MPLNGVNGLGYRFGLGPEEVLGTQCVGVKSVDPLGTTGGEGVALGRVRR